MSWFTGEAVQDDDIGDIVGDEDEEGVEDEEDEDDEDDDEDDEDDEEDDEEEEQSKSKKVITIFSWISLHLWLVEFSWWRC